MRFLIDAQLPRRLTLWLQAAGYQAVHTTDLPTGNYTSDEEINDFSIQHQYIVVTKDADFVVSFFLKRKPYKLLLISTGNISNQNLLTIIENNIQTIADLFKTHEFIELSRTDTTIHF